MKKEFKYYPEDFGDLTVKVIHMDLIFDIYDDHTQVDAVIGLKNLDKSINKLELNANNLELLGLSCNFCDVDFNYKKSENKIIIKFKKTIQPKTEFFISTKTICKPTKNILEGLYYDETPELAPLQQITQCQQWGFQRLVPCIDDMTAKCTYRTTIIADNRYTNLITNGDVFEERSAYTKTRDKIIYNNTKTPMAPYLFFLGVGTYASFKKEFEYPDGDKFMLELLVPPYSNEGLANRSLEVLSHGIMWIYLFTGKNTYLNKDKKNLIFSLIHKRDELKKEGYSEELEKVRKKLKDLVSGLNLGYKYTGTVYREIGMQNTNFGGMENVGNTTVTTNRILPFKDMTDGSFEYMIRVKCHEFYHNLNGSEVTGWSPFEIWLNEAVTVHIETDYFAYLCGRDYQRLNRVLDLLAPSGVFYQDTSAKSMPIEPDGFNNPDELITGMTYVKAPEFVRMIQQIIGEKYFVEGLALYHKKYKHGNATRVQWLNCMEEVSGVHLKEMANGWLKQTGYPIVYVNTNYNQDKRVYNIYLEQKNKDNKLWDFPFKAGLVDFNGYDIGTKSIRVSGKKTYIVFENVDEPAFCSLNRECSFYGKVDYGQSDDELYLQVKLDNDIVNRYMAFYHLADREKMRLLHGSNEVSSRFIDLYYSLLFDKKLGESLGGSILAFFPSVEDEAYAHKYQKLYDVKENILLSIAAKYRKELLELYNECLDKTFEGIYIEKELKEIKNRTIKNICLSLLSRLNDFEINKLIKKQYDSAIKASDKLIAFSLYLRSNVSDKLEVLEKHEEEAKKNPVSWETFLATVASNESDDALEIIKRVEGSESFRIEQANDQRALYAIFAMNKRKSLLTKEGRDFIRDVMIKLAPINEYNTVYILGIFGKIDYLDIEYQIECVKILIEVIKSLDKDQVPSVYNNIKRILNNSKKAVKSYENINGEIDIR